jgi:hypothetical protein
MTRICFVFFILFSANSLAGPLDQLATMNKALNGSCDYQVQLNHKGEKELLCIVSAIASRCENEVDDCYSYCLLTDLNITIGGGCAHICNYGNRKKWSYPSGTENCNE